MRSMLRLWLIPRVASYIERLKQFHNLYYKIVS